MAALGWKFWEVGGALGVWVIGYGIIQGSAPALRRAWGSTGPPGPSAVQFWCAVLTAIPDLIAVALWREVAQPGVAIVVGLAAFGAVFAMASSIHSYLVLAYTDAESVSLNVCFYYMANAAGRLLGTLLSGAVFLVGGACGARRCWWLSPGASAWGYPRCRGANLGWLEEQMLSRESRSSDKWPGSMR